GRNSIPDLSPTVVRGSAALTTGDLEDVVRITIHPSRKSQFGDLLESFMFQPAACKDIDFYGSDTSGVISIRVGVGDQFHADIPSVSCLSNREMCFLDPAIPLNEFGIMYLI